MPFLGARTPAPCTVEVKGRDRTFTLDISKVEGLAREDTLVFMAAGGQKLAIVGDPSKPDQYAKLTALATALIAVGKRCTKRPG